MADQKGSADADPDKDHEGEDDGKGADTVEEKGNDGGKDLDKSGAGDGKGTKGDDKGSSDGEGEDLDPSKHEIKTRGKRPADFVAERRGKKIQKLQGEDGESDDEEDDEDAELSEQASAAIDKKIAPVVKFLEKSADDKDFADHLKANPDHQKFEPLARKYAQHPSYANVPIPFIFAALSARNAQAAGAARARAADKEARESAAGGKGGSRKLDVGEIPENIWDLSDKEFEALQNQVLQGKQK